MSWLLSNPLRSAARPPLGSEARLPRGFAGSGETLSETRAEMKARCVGRCANARCWQRAAERTKLPRRAPLPPSWWDMSVGTALEFHLLHPTWLRRIPYPGSGTRPDTHAAAAPPAPLPPRTVPARPHHPCPPRSPVPHRYGSDPGPLSGPAAARAPSIGCRVTPPQLSTNQRPSNELCDNSSSNPRRAPPPPRSP